MKVFGVLFVGLFVLIGLAFVGYGLWGVAEGVASSSWPAVRGQVTASEYTVIASEPTQYRVKPSIEYAYRVAGDDYLGQSVVIGSFTDHSPTNTRRITNRYLVGEAVDVFYDPNEPTSAVLETGVPFVAWVFVGIGLVVTVVPAAIVIAVFRSLHKSTAGQRRSPRAGAVAKLIFAPFLITGIVLVFFGLRSWQKADESLAWPKVDGTVSYSGIEIDERTEDGHTSYTYTPRVVYDFVIDGVTYTSEGITLGDSGSSNRRSAESKAGEYPKGRTVDVFYNPSDQYDATLVTGRSSGTWIMMILGGVFTLVGCVIYTVAVLMVGRRDPLLDAIDSPTDDDNSWDDS